MTMKQVEEEYKKLMDEIEASKERIESETSWKSRCEELAKINKEHQKLNGELRKENDALITVIDLVKEYVEKNKEKLYQGRNDFTCEIRYSDEVVKAKDLLEILERVNEID